MTAAGPRFGRGWIGSGLSRLRHQPDRGLLVPSDEDFLAWAGNTPSDGGTAHPHALFRDTYCRSAGEPSSCPPNPFTCLHDLVTGELHCGFGRRDPKWSPRLGRLRVRGGPGTGVGRGFMEKMRCHLNSGQTSGVNRWVQFQRAGIPPLVHDEGREKARPRISFASCYNSVSCAIHMGATPY
jgi:hypothetical protein